MHLVGPEIVIYYALMGPVNAVVFVFIHQVN